MRSTSETADANRMQAVMEAEARRIHAITRADFAALEGLLCDDLVHIHSTGLVHNKGQYLEYLHNSLRFLQIDCGPAQIKLVGEVAMVHGRMTNLMQAAGKPEPVRATSETARLWVERAGSWKLLAFQATRAPSSN